MDRRKFYILIKIVDYLITSTIKMMIMYYIQCKNQKVFPMKIQLGFESLSNMITKPNNSMIGLCLKPEYKMSFIKSSTCINISWQKLATFRTYPLQIRGDHEVIPLLWTKNKYPLLLSNCKIYCFETKLDAILCSSNDKGFDCMDTSIFKQQLLLCLTGTTLFNISNSKRPNVKWEFAAVVPLTEILGGKLTLKRYADLETNWINKNGSIIVILESRNTQNSWKVIMLLKVKHW